MLHGHAALQHARRLTGARFGREARPRRLPNRLRRQLPRRGCKWRRETLRHDVYEVELGARSEVDHIDDAAKVDRRRLLRVFCTTPTCSGSEDAKHQPQDGKMHCAV